MRRYKAINWYNYFHDIGLKPELIDEYMPFVQSCISKKIPPIFETKHLALLLGMDIGDLHSMVFATDKFYRVFRIRKRSGGYREIRAPYPSLLAAQKWIKNEVLQYQRISNSVTGFRPKYSIINNAKIHCKRDILLKIDIKEFFPNINFRRTINVFIKLGYPENIAFILSKLCSLDNQLPQGSATSPILSNIICYRMDNRIYRLCKKRRLRYTRYADDMAISGAKIEEGIRRLIFEIIESEGFVINQKKVRFLGRNERKIITGLDITSGKPRLTRKNRREIQKDVFFVWSVGLSSHVSRRRIFKPNYIEHLNGRVEFWRSVEPDNPQLLKVHGRMSQILSLKVH